MCLSMAERLAEGEGSEDRRKAEKAEGKSHQARLSTPRRITQSRHAKSLLAHFWKRWRGSLGQPWWSWMKRGRVRIRRNDGCDRRHRRSLLPTVVTTALPLFPLHLCAQRIALTDGHHLLFAFLRRIAYAACLPRFLLKARSCCCSPEVKVSLVKSSASFVTLSKSLPSPRPQSFLIFLSSLSRPDVLVLRYPASTMVSQG